MNDQETKMTSSAGEKTAAVRGGFLGEAIGFIVFIAMIIIMSVMGIGGSKGFWAAGVIAVLVSWFTFKDKDVFMEAVKSGMKDNIFVITMIALLFAGVLSREMNVGGLVNGLMWAAAQIHLSSSMLPVMTFLVCVVISTATGTSSGTVATVAPIMLPLGYQMGCMTGLMCGAILSGAYFGDNLAPISDTTIASALTQEAELIDVVRSRLKYALIGGAFAAVMYIIMGIRTTNTLAAQAFKADPSAASNIVYIALPILVVILMLKKWNLLSALLMGDFAGAVIMLIKKDVTFAGLINGEDGIISIGFQNMMGATILVMFTFIIANIAVKNGFMDRIIEWAHKHAKSARSAEAIQTVLISVMMLVTGSNTSSIAITGPVVRKILKPYKIDRCRTANILDCMTAGIGGIIPQSPASALVAAQAISLGIVGSGFTFLSYWMYSYHCLALIAIMIFAVATGWGRKYEDDEQTADESENAIVSD
jgi:Na+/H+ antiporter